MLIDIILLAGAIAWITTTLVYKEGPFGFIKTFRDKVFYILRDNSPLRCPHCTSFWVGLVFLTLYTSGDYVSMGIIQFFGVLGIAQALRGISGDWG
jgi:hypothetical protein